MENNCGCNTGAKEESCAPATPSCGCGGDAQAIETRYVEKPYWVTGFVKTAAGDIPKISTDLVFADKLGSVKTRLGVGRMNYAVAPGLYAAGNPKPDSPVLVSANYKLSFDVLRSKLSGRDAWILVIDTKGINVWCAAGKGTFGTDEIVRRTEAVRLQEVVSHRALVVPQLGAPGVSAHEVKKRSGFRVVYGPVRADDLCAFLDAGMKATTEMRRVRFPLRDRLVLIPVECGMGTKYVLGIMAAFFLLSSLGAGGISAQRMVSAGIPSALMVLVIYLAGMSLTPALLPWLPGKAFSVKGASAGLAIASAILLLALLRPGMFGSYLCIAALFLIIPSVTSFIGMNFTGASTYTSLSGVKREMRIALPVQGVCAGAGLALWIAGRFV